MFRKIGGFLKKDSMSKNRKVYKVKIPIIINPLPLSRINNENAGDLYSQLINQYKSLYLFLYFLNLIIQKFNLFF